MSDEWIDISSAPLDGTRIRVTLVGMEWVAWWNPCEGAFQYAHRCFLDMPTHWQQSKPLILLGACHE